MQSFGSFLKREARISEKYVPFFLRWVSLFHNFSRDSVQGEEDRAKVFLAVLARRQKSWQVKQAEKAIALYARYRKRQPPNREGVILRSQPKTIPGWQSMAAATVRILRMQHKAYSTEKTYLNWLERFSAYINPKATSEVTQEDLTDYLSYLAVEKRVSASTQKQAFNALLFVYLNVLGLQINDLEGVVRSRTKRNLPVVLSKSEIAHVLSLLYGTHRLMAGIIYGGGLRLRECLMLRIKDLDFDRGCITVRAGKGNKDRQTLLADSLRGDLLEQVRRAREIFDADRRNNVAGVWLPDAIARKYLNAGYEWIWFWIFPSHRLSVDPQSKIVRRHHLYPSTLQKAFKQAVLRAGISKRATLHSLRHYAERRIMPISA